MLEGVFDSVGTTMITVPNLPAPLRLVLIDGVNIARARKMWGRVIYEDLLGCVQSLREVGMQVCVILDDTHEGRDAQHFLRAKAGFEWTWRCPAADPVLLEAASRLDYSAILSRDDFAEFQEQYVLVLFDHGRTLSFDCAHGIGSGQIFFRPVTEKYRQQIYYHPLSDFVTLLDLFLTIKDLRAAAQLCSDVDSLVSHYDKTEERPIHVAIAYARILVQACGGRTPGWIDRMRFSFETQALNRTNGAQWPCSGKMFRHLPVLLRHVQSGGAFANFAAEQRLRSLYAKVAQLSKEDVIHD